jgi:hypothetical protein
VIAFDGNVVYDNVLNSCPAVDDISNAQHTSITFTNVIKTYVNPIRISEDHQNFAPRLL